MKIRVVGGAKAFRSAVALVTLLWMVCAAMPLHASALNPVQVSVVARKGGQYIEPIDRRILIQSIPAGLFIRIRNTSDAALSVRVNPEMAYSIELKDEDGRTSMVKRKSRPGTNAGDDTRVRLSPGAEQVITVSIDPDTWEGLPVVTAGKESKYTARAVYEDANGRHVYSEPYTLIFSISE
jgi:hypothetical protein